MKASNTMVQRFLSWRLPGDFAPDGGISYKPVERHPEWTHDTRPTGTNLLTDPQARAMLEHVVGPEFDALELLLELVAPLAYAQWKSGSCDPVEAVVSPNEPVTGSGAVSREDADRG